MPELVSTLCTFLVLAPLALMPGLGEFLFQPMALAVAFAMIAAYILSRTLVPSRCAAWLRPHAGHDHGDDAATDRAARAGRRGPSPAGRAGSTRAIAAYVAVARRASCGTAG